MKKTLKVVLCAVVMTFLMSFTAFASGWSTEEVSIGVAPDGSDNGEVSTMEHRVYYDENENKVVGQWKWITDSDGATYCYKFDEQGFMESDCVTSDGYYLDSDGHWCINGIPQTVETFGEILETDEDYRSIFMSISDADMDLLRKTLWLEACNTTFDCKVATLEVILNRVLNPAFSNSVGAVIAEKGQFSTYRNTGKISEGKFYKPYGSVVDYSEIDNVINYVAANGRTELDQSYVFFATYKANGKNFIRIGEHWFSTL